jgi:micrococcal nuclease
MRPALRLVLLLALLASPAVAGERLVGRARVIDGDTIVIGGVHVRLQGVAAPEVAHPGQPQDEPGGPEAWAFMQGLVEDRTVVCALTGERSRGRRVGTCMVDGRDIGGELIEAGLARDCARYSHGRYAALEPEAARRLPLPSYCSAR